jgi:ATP adenylyltransferase/5',5'''-P-1,P-4-tetraphosphate phosphorylase II
VAMRPLKIVFLFLGELFKYFKVLTTKIIMDKLNVFLQSVIANLLIFIKGITCLAKSLTKFDDIIKIEINTRTIQGNAFLTLNEKKLSTTKEKIPMYILLSVGSAQGRFSPVNGRIK